MACLGRPEEGPSFDPEEGPSFDPGEMPSYGPGEMPLFDPEPVGLREPLDESVPSAEPKAPDRKHEPQPPAARLSVATLVLAFVLIMAGSVLVMFIIVGVIALAHL